MVHKVRCKISVNSFTFIVAAVRVSQEAGINLALSPASSSEGISHMSSSGGQHEACVIAGVIADAPTSTASTPPQQTTTSLALSDQEPDNADKLALQSSRLFSTTSSPDPSATAKSDAAIPLNQASQSHPPGGSRLLALASRNPQNAAVSSVRSTSSQSPTLFVQKNSNVGVNAVLSTGVSQSIEPSPHFTSVADTLRPNNGFFPFDDHRDAPVLPNASASEATHRGPLSLAGDRTVFPVDHVLPAEPGLGGGFSSSHAVQSFEPVGSSIASAKGSRFAKFFDGKGRDSQSALGAKAPIGMGTPGLSQPAPQKMDIPGLHPPHNSEARAMEDIFAMLNNSAQVSVDPIRRQKFFIF